MPFAKAAGGLQHGLPPVAVKTDTPPMGLSTWSVFRSTVNDTLIRQLADAMVSSGMLAAGYNSLLVDDGWAGKGCSSCLPNRDDNGRLVVDAAKFPLGMKATAQYVHSKGLKFGLWFGHSMCAPSNDTNKDSPDYATLDAAFFASVEVDAIKHDNCVDVANTTDAVNANYERYARLGAALNATGRPILYDVVLQVAHEREVPAYDYGYLWSPEVYGKARMQALANSWWSLPVNKYNCWSCCVGASNERIVDDALCTSSTGHACRRGLLPMIDTQDMGTAGFSVSGHWDWAGKGKGWVSAEDVSLLLFPFSSVFLRIPHFWCSCVSFCCHCRQIEAMYVIASHSMYLIVCIPCATLLPEPH
jgi:hypothetical protein